jgi:hypothetical protein
VLPPHSGGQGASAPAEESSPFRDTGGASLDGTKMVACDAGNDAVATPPVSKSRVDNSGPAGTADLGVSVVFDRRTFVRRRAGSTGASAEMLARGWNSGK